MPDLPSKSFLSKVIAKSMQAWLQGLCVISLTNNLGFDNGFLCRLLEVTVCLCRWCRPQHGSQGEAQNMPAGLSHLRMAQSASVPLLARGAQLWK